MRRGLLLAAAATLLAGCGGGFEPDMPVIEGQIRDDLADQLGVTPSRLSMDCPSVIDWRPGEEFRCIVEDKRGNRRQVVVHMENDRGELSWELTT